MTIFLAALGASAENVTKALEQRLCHALKPAGTATLMRRGRLAVARVDLGLWPGPCVAESELNWLLMAGDPVLGDSAGGSLSRPDSIRRLATDLQCPGLAPFRQLEGTCCGLAFDASRDTLIAFTDKLGVRPLYWANVGGVTYLSSALWLLESLESIPLEPDWLGAAETACFGFPLADRTIHCAIKTLPSGSALVMQGGAVEVVRYWDWAALAENPVRGEALVRQVRDAFDTAVAARVDGQKHVMAFLSGGLDSRLIAARLRHAGAEVSTLNFAPQGTQDLLLGRAAAQALGTRHSEFTSGGDNFAQRHDGAIADWRTACADRSLWPDHPGLVWSGDGGSVALGHVYLSEEVVRAARSQDGITAAANTIAVQNRLGLTPHLFTPRWRHLSKAHLRGIEADLASRPNVEPGRNSHLFFMLNDQRRHLAGHFERIHLKGFDLVLPFFDGRFVATVLSSQVDPFLGHGLYNELMASLPGPITQVPWQSYPGHHPGPVPVPSGLRKQWGDGWYDAITTRRQRRTFLWGSLRGLTSLSFPSDVLNRTKLLASLASGLVGVKRFTYMVENTVPFLRAWSRRRLAPKWSKGERAGRSVADHSAQEQV